MTIPLTACAAGTTTTTGTQPTSKSAPISSNGAAMTDQMTDAMNSGSVLAGASAGPSGSMMDHPDSAMMSEDSMHPSDTVSAESSPAVTTPGITITTAASDFGLILFDSTGQAIYLFDKETSTTPDCYAECAAAWPPVLTAGPPVATNNANAGLLGTTSRTDGSTQVTYAGHPLYYYAHEGKDEVTCHNVTEFGGRWLVVTPTGQAAG